MANLPTVDHVEKAKEESLFQFEDKETFQGLLASWVKQIQGAEDLIQKFYLINIESAVGVQLDELYGELFNVERLGRSDTQYRAAILAKVATFGADGTFENLQANLENVTNSDKVRIFEHYPADVHVHLGGTYSGYTYQDGKDLTQAGVSARFMVDQDFDSFVMSEIFPAQLDVQVDQSGVPYDIQIDQTGTPYDIQIDQSAINSENVQFAILPEIEDKNAGESFTPLAELIFKDGQVPDPNNLILGIVSSQLSRISSNSSIVQTNSAQGSPQLNRVSSTSSAQSLIVSSVNSTLSRVVAEGTNTAAVGVIAQGVTTLNRVTSSGVIDVEDVVMGSVNTTLNSISSATTGVEQVYEDFEQQVVGQPPVLPANTSGAITNVLVSDEESYEGNNSLKFDAAGPSPLNWNRYNITPDQPTVGNSYTEAYILFPTNLVQANADIIFSSVFTLDSGGTTSITMIRSNGEISLGSGQFLSSVPVAEWTRVRLTLINPLEVMVHFGEVSAKLALPSSVSGIEQIGILNRTPNDPFYMDNFGVYGGLPSGGVGTVRNSASVTSTLSRVGLSALSVLGNPPIVGTMSATLNPLGNNEQIIESIDFESSTVGQVDPASNLNTYASVDDQIAFQGTQSYKLEPVSPDTSALTSFTFDTLPAVTFRLNRFTNPGSFIIFIRAATQQIISYVLVEADGSMSLPFESGRRILPPNSILENTWHKLGVKVLNENSYVVEFEDKVIAQGVAGNSLPPVEVIFQSAGVDNSDKPVWIDSIEVIGGGRNIGESKASVIGSVASTLNPVTSSGVGSVVRNDVSGAISSTLSRVTFTSSAQLLNPVDSFIVTTRSDDTPIIYDQDLVERRLLPLLSATGDTKGSISLDGRYYAFITGSGSSTVNLYVYDLWSGNYLPDYPVTVNSFNVEDLKISPENQFVLVYGGVNGPFTDGHLFDLQSGTLSSLDVNATNIRLQNFEFLDEDNLIGVRGDAAWPGVVAAVTINIPSETVTTFTLPDNPVETHYVSVSPDERFFAIYQRWSATSTPRVYIYENAIGYPAVANAFDTSPAGENYIALTGGENGVLPKFSNDGRYLALVEAGTTSATSTVYVYDCQSTPFTLVDSIDPPSGGRNPQFDFTAAWSPDGQYLAIGSRSGANGGQGAEVYSFDGFSLSPENADADEVPGDITSVSWAGP